MRRGNLIARSPQGDAAISKAEIASLPLVARNDTSTGQSLTPNSQPLVPNTSTNIFRQTILPAIDKAVNESQDFADVRQIYNSVILAAWYKKALKESLLGKVYADQGKVAGVETDEKEMKQHIYEQYLAAFKKGAYNLIKEEVDADGDLIPHKYFSGGAVFEVANIVSSAAITLNQAENIIAKVSSAAVTVQLGTTGEEVNTLNNLVAVNPDTSSSSAVTNAQIQKVGNNFALSLAGDLREQALLRFAFAHIVAHLKQVNGNPAQWTGFIESIRSTTTSSRSFFARLSVFTINDTINYLRDNPELLSQGQIDLAELFSKHFISENKRTIAQLVKSIRDLVLSRDVTVQMNKAIDDFKTMRVSQAYSALFYKNDKVGTMQKRNLQTVRSELLQLPLYKSDKRIDGFMDFMTGLQAEQNQASARAQMLIRYEQYSDLYSYLAFYDSDNNVLLDAQRSLIESILNNLNDEQIDYFSPVMNRKTLLGLAHSKEGFKRGRLWDNLVDFAKKNMIGYGDQQKQSLPDAKTASIPPAANLTAETALKMLSDQIDVIAVLLYERLAFPANNLLPALDQDDVVARDVLKAVFYEMHLHLFNDQSFDSAMADSLEAGQYISSKRSLVDVKAALERLDLGNGQVGKIIEQPLREALAKAQELSASSGVDQQQAARAALIGKSLITQKALIAALQDNLLRPGDQVKVQYKHFASNGAVSTREQVGTISKIVPSTLPRKTGRFEYQRNIDQTTLLYVDDRGIALENMVSLTLEKTAASSSVRQYLLPMDDPITRGAVMSMAEIVFKQARFITDEDILNFKINFMWATFLNLNISQKEVVVDSLASDNPATRIIAQAVLLAANSYPAIFSDNRLQAVIDNLLVYAEHFREIEQYQIFDERFRDSHALAVRFLASHLIVLDVDPGEFIALVHDIQQNIQSIQSTHTSIEQYLKKAEIENDFIVEIIREALPASFRNTENWGEFYFILSDAQRFLNNKQIESAIMSLGYSVASSGVNDKTEVASTPTALPVGGINFDPTNMDLQIKRDGKGVPLSLPQQNLEQINIQGLFPVIIHIVPMNAQTLPIFLGQLPKGPVREPELAAATSG
ncbi:MAG: hypothetical protein H6753_05845 [Candidatus Omnitrophica bacterium]|nr:hypothetical protein [Candidatus Omnitrophota bacterium]